ncbi:GNAT family N-acetyltransferase [Methylobacterium sp. BTF04]|uniref:GNAT family N-acetyltransferase n=1 Tax=Methylobacterium sp. BTF04 TaxID=2708300 RepID=UPI0032B17168
MPDTILPLVRRLWPSDDAQVQDYILRLDPETRAERFMGTLSDTAARTYARNAMRADGLMFGGFVAGTLRGLGELRPAGARSPGRMLGPEAEAAFAVERGYRRNGLGQALFRRIAGAARHRGVRDLHVRCLSWNRPMQGLARKVGASLRIQGDEADGALHLARPTPVSLWQEGVAEAFDFTLALSAA